MGKICGGPSFPTSPANAIGRNPYPNSTTLRLTSTIARAEGFEHDAYDFYIHDQHATVKVGLNHRVFGGLSIIIPVVIAAVLLVAAAVYLADRKPRVAGLQLHRESIPTIGGDAGVEG